MQIKISKMILVNFFLISFSLLSGCAIERVPVAQNNDCQSASASATDDPSAYGLYVDSSGDLRNFDNKDKIPDPTKYLRNIFYNFNALNNSADKKLELTVFIHGGLNDSSHVRDRIRSLKSAMLQDCKYPLFISWRSGFWGNTADHLLFLRNGEYKSTKDLPSSFIEGPLTTPFVLAEDTLRALARVPAATYKTLFENNVTAINLRAEYFGGTKDENKDERLDDIKQYPKEQNEENTELALGDYWSILNPVKLLTAPVADSFGTGAFNSMLRRTDLVLAKYNGDREPNGSRNNFPSSCAINIQNGETAVGEFFNYWQCQYSKDRINLIGHSMGSIIANKIVSKYSSIKFSNIVYMAAACSLSDIEQTITPYLMHNPQTQFYNLTLHPKRDRFEMVYADFIPRGSLLWWIDNIPLANVNSKLDKTAGYWDNFNNVASQIFPLEIRNRVHLTKFDFNGDVPKKHGDFDNFPFWNENFWKASHTVPSIELKPDNNPIQ